MAKKQSKSVSDFAVHEKQEILSIVETVSPNEQAVELPVKIAINCEKATYKITATLTTKAVHPTNEDVRDAIAENIRQMIRQAMDKAEERRRYWSEQNEEGDPDQLDLGFEDEEQ